MPVPCRRDVSSGEQGVFLALGHLSCKLGTPVTMHTPSLTFPFSSFSPFPFPWEKNIKMPGTIIFRLKHVEILAQAGTPGTCG